MLAEQNPDIKKAVVRLTELSADEIAPKGQRVRISAADYLAMRLEAAEKYFRDQRQYISDAEEQGLCEGWAQALKEVPPERLADVTANVATSMLKHGFSVAAACEMTGLTHAEVRQIAERVTPVLSIQKIAINLLRLGMTVEEVADLTKLDVLEVRILNMPGRCKSTVVAVAGRMLQRGLPIEDICAVTGLTEEDVQSLAESED